LHPGSDLDQGLLGIDAVGHQAPDQIGPAVPSGDGWGIANLAALVGQDGTILGHNILSGNQGNIGRAIVSLALGIDRAGPGHRVGPQAAPEVVHAIIGGPVLSRVAVPDPAAVDDGRQVDPEYQPIEQRRGVLADGHSVRLDLEPGVDRKGPHQVVHQRYRPAEGHDLALAGCNRVCCRSGLGDSSLD
jgi:hypothetical protein